MKTQERSSRAKPVVAYIGLGSNQGDSDIILANTITELAQVKGCQHLHTSSFYKSAPVEIPDDLVDQPDFLNAVIALEVTLSPLDLLGEMARLEKKMGRSRGPDSIRYGPRPLDLDLLLFGSEVIDLEQLTVPHPRIFQRRFVLEPLLEIAPDISIPGQGKAACLLLDCCCQRVVKL
ncbi:MAG: 2-amino-4-hydroxy-6-hydroxymethyldihydropteridine diphosphokinase [Arenicellales bacterium]|jgi:2-amino-4-hydroxy-6-hydroxymethyldihydropteridine diphosphokinase|nr:2-amino-4-hydroxy-6-hydroxymethyldihydropteridine diphosphokinase [Arenicellales bacterium]MDP7482467.1 2-amino-4-hydroxy-6-hydroxymethyldihydropteridine diphosphokinase [Arenicellales bacterium]